MSLAQRALVEQPPDLVIFLDTPPRTESEVQADIAHAQDLAGFIRERHDQRPFGFAVTVGNLLGTPVSELRPHLNDILDDLAKHGFGEKVAGSFVLPEGTPEVHRLATAIATHLPDEAKLEMARLSGVKEVQRQLAQVVVKSVSAISGAIGAEPIPLADFPVLTSLQAGMVAGIMYISGRDLSPKLGAEFIAALGMNIGVGLALREGARAALKVIPVWGHLVSGGVAAAGTYGIGKAAIGYFVDEMSLPDARKLFKNRKKAKKAKPELLQDHVDGKQE
jgi:uncharacterized protein (DUF697 family)